MDRELDGYYFRVKRDDRWQNICFSDLSQQEMEEVLENKGIEFCKSLCIGLGKRIHEIGDELRISCREK